ATYDSWAYNQTQNSDGDWIIRNSSMDFSFNESQLSTRFYNASLITVTTGTTSSSLSDIQAYDGVTYDIDEDTSDVFFTVNFTGVSDFNNLIIRYRSAEEDLLHVMAIEIYDYGDNDWEEYGTLVGNAIFQIVQFGVFDTDEHIQDGVVSVRIFQDEGVPGKTHMHEFDWITISKGFGTPSGQEIDPFSIHTNGDTPLSANWDAGLWNITSSWIKAKLNWSYIQDIPSYVKAWTFKLNTTDFTGAWDSNWTAKDYDKWMYNQSDGSTNSSYMTSITN
ncbi:unnamed protein product, partial [marine sediment metagenome]